MITAHEARLRVKTPDNSEIKNKVMAKIEEKILASAEQGLCLCVFNDPDLYACVSEVIRDLADLGYELLLRENLVIRWSEY